MNKDNKINEYDKDLSKKARSWLLPDVETNKKKIENKEQL